MFYIVDSDDQLKRLEESIYKRVYIDIVSSDNRYHPKLTTAIAVYLHLVDEDEGYIIPLQHNEGLNIEKKRVLDVLNSFDSIYTLNKKNVLYHFNLSKLIDISLLYSMTFYEKLEIPEKGKTSSWYYGRLPEIPHINQVIPLSKLYEDCKNTYNAIKKHIKIPIPPGFDFYNTLATSVFYRLEQKGLGIYKKPFIDLFKPRDPRFNIVDDRVLTLYNLYNATSRPTNSFNSVNFAAIPKAAEYRKCFTPKNDFFVEFDFDSYHIRLLAQQLGYPLTKESGHKQLAKLYLGRDDLTEQEYLQAKQVNFQAVYGKIPDSYKSFGFFKEVQEYIEAMWDVYTDLGEISAPISGKLFTTNLKDMNPQKLMNYLMQNLETSRNILILDKVLKYLEDKKTDVVLYTYDALLFDFSKEDTKDLLVGLEAILTESDKFPVKFKYAKTLLLG